MNSRLVPISLLVLQLLLQTSCSYEKEDPCEGKVEGTCGLTGQCVECVFSKDCDYPKAGILMSNYNLRDSPICEYNSDCPDDRYCIDYMCVIRRFCSIRGECRRFCPPTGTNECNADEVCVDSICLLACQTDQDCLEGAGTCQPEGYCFFKMCLPRGTCSANWDPIEGTLICRFVGG
jgi:hypothetical protein